MTALRSARLRLRLLHVPRQRDRDRMPESTPHGSRDALRRTGAVLWPVAGAVVWWTAGGVRGVGTAVAFAGVVALGAALRVRGESGGRDGAPLATAGALGYALLGPHAGAGVVRAVSLALAATAAGALLRTGLPHRRARRSPPAKDLPAAAEPSPAATPYDRRGRHAACASGLNLPGRLARTRPVVARVACRAGGPARLAAVVGVAAVCCQPLGDAWPLTGAARVAYLAGVLAVTAGWDALLTAAPAARRGAPAVVAALRDDIVALAGLGCTVGAGALVLALAADGAGPWAVLPAAVPPLLAQLSLRGRAAVRATYAETVASLARATEVAGYTPPGHARRVSALATAVGRELGLTARRLRVLEHAALMHDIGQLSLVDPLPHGATEPLDDERRREVAALGGEVVRRTGAPPEVALVVERQAHPYREQPLAGRIVRVANAYEDLSGAAAAGPQPLHTRLAAVERMRLATAYDYDPRVVEALTRVLARRCGPAWLDAREDGKEDR